ncbi:MAG: nucleotidyltransferase domain-containing protein [Candidatus Freyarchaeota archaeon]
MVLFGSLARGEHRETSDTDLLVITSGNPFDMQKRLSEVAVNILLEILPEHSQRRRNRWMKQGYS